MCSGQTNASSHARAAGSASAAIGLGYHGRAICRDGGPAPGVPSIASLTEVLDPL